MSKIIVPPSPFATAETVAQLLTEVNNWHLKFKISDEDKGWPRYWPVRSP
jgi:hypothetical protein